MTDWQPVDAVPDLMGSDVHVWSVALEELDVAPLRPLLTDTERATADRYRDPDRGRVSVASRGVLRVLLSGYLGRTPAGIPLAVNAHGKPLLDRAGVDLQFNVAHAGARMLLAFALDRAVGVDVEDTTRDVDLDVLARRYFDEPERAALDASSDRRATFFRLWVRKEARLKALGTGFEATDGEPYDAAVADLPGLGACVGALAAGDAPSVRLFRFPTPVSLT